MKDLINRVGKRASILGKWIVKNNWQISLSSLIIISGLQSYLDIVKYKQEERRPHYGFKTLHSSVIFYDDDPEAMKAFAEVDGKKIEMLCRSGKEATYLYGKSVKKEDSREFIIPKEALYAKKTIIYSVDSRRNISDKIELFPSRKR